VIYLSFASKEEVFRALSERLSQRMLAGAKAASRRPGTTADKLAAMHAAWFGTYADTISRSPNAAELLDAKHRLSADLVTGATSRYKRLVRDVLTDAAVAGELDLEPVSLTADTAAELLIAPPAGWNPAQPRPSPTGTTSTRWSGSWSPGYPARTPPTPYHGRRREAAGRRCMSPSTAPGGWPWRGSDGALGRGDGDQRVMRTRETSSSPSSSDRHAGAARYVEQSFRQWHDHVPAPAALVGVPERQISGVRVGVKHEIFQQAGAAEARDVLAELQALTCPRSAQ
jgi:hypothetical protein